jgi:acyl-homoserine-lactone acylase
MHRRRTTRATLSLAVAGALTALTAVVAQPAASAAPADPAGVLAPADGVPRATISRTSYGIPHVVADDFESLGFGQGFAAAEDSVCLLADTLLTGRGERSRFFGPTQGYDDQVTLDATNLQVDTLFGNLRDRKVVEALLDDPVRGPGEEVRAMVRGYVAGVNSYVASVGGPAGIEDPACKGAEWVRPAEPLDLYYGIYAANLLASTGVFVPEIVEAAPPSAADPGLPVRPPAAAPFASVPEALPSSDALMAGLGKDPAAPFGSNGTALGGDATVTGKGMVLGNPHFPWRGRYRFTQSHLTIPGVYDVAGAMLHGSPVVNIGWNSSVAWTHTVSTGYRFTPYEYRTVPGAPTTYLTEAGPRQLERNEVRVPVRNPDGSVGEVVQDLYRTDEGYVLDAPEVLLGWTPVSFFALRDANAEHLRTLDSFHEMAKATDVRGLLDAQNRTAGIPWVNTMAADRAGDALYADSAVVPNVPERARAAVRDAGRPRPVPAGRPAGAGRHRGQGRCAWRDDADAARPGSSARGTSPTPCGATGWSTPTTATGCPTRSSRWRASRASSAARGASAACAPGWSTATCSTGSTAPTAWAARTRSRWTSSRRRSTRTGCSPPSSPASATTCRTSAGPRRAGQACDVLRAWDGRTNIDSVGRTSSASSGCARPPPGGRCRSTPADPSDPARDLDEATPTSCGDARRCPSCAERACPSTHRWPLQVPRTTAPRASRSRRSAQTGNATSSTRATRRRTSTRSTRISRGSSHIQAVRPSPTTASTPRRSSPTASRPTPSARHVDQTELFSQERWVDFPFTRGADRRRPRAARRTS